ncbi:hypothetical protein GH714_012249 [Hevea brasiliensis]|uniref:Uncharacterized protein n=1 Tax=Hevea brasiliensis TaxID=3981 RepID=A0A6A6NGT4_HEVBR|nr:hypothetical protein GH714_012249 [Hevea brasiliensis]
MAGGDEIDVNLPSEEYFPTAITEDIIAAPELAAREGRTRQPPIRLADYVSGEVSLISRFMACPTQLHFAAVKRILRYLKGTVNYGVFYKRGGASNLVGFTDSDYAGDMYDSKSTSGYVFQMSGGAVAWSSRKQPIVTLSTTEAEFVAAAACACQAIWMRRILKEIDFSGLLLDFGYRRVLLVSSPSAVEECFTKNDVVFANRPRLLHGKHLGYNYTSLVWAPYGDLWRNLRKLSSLEILSSHRLQLLSSIRSDEVLLAAGTDTSAVTMEWAMSLLVNDIEILKKAQNEIDNVIGHDRLMTESDTLKIPYLHCIISEVMRMYPPGPLLVPHESSEECSIGGYRVPPGTMLIVNMWSIQNDPRVWEEPGNSNQKDLKGVRQG